MPGCRLWYPCRTEERCQQCNTMMTPLKITGRCPAYTPGADVGLRRALVIGLLGFCSQVFAIDLIQVYQSAIENDPTYAAARANFAANAEKLVQAKGALLPNATLSVNRARNQLENSSVGFQSDYSSSGFTLQLTQPLYNRPAWTTYQQGRSLLSQSEAQLDADTHELMVRVVDTYFDVVAALDLADTSMVLERASQEQSQMAQESLQEGTGTITEVDEAKARADLARAQTIVARNDLEIKRHSLAELVGRETPDVLRLRVKASVASPLPLDMVAWVRSAEQDNPSVRARRYAFEVAQLEIDRSRGAHLPTVELVASRQGARSINTLSGAPNNTLQNALTIQLNMPLYQGGRQISRDREAIALKDKSQAELLDTQRSARQLARQSYLGVVSALSQSDALTMALASSVSSLEGNRMGLEVGTRRTLDVLNALAQVADSRQKLTKAKIDGIVSQVRLKAAVGRLTESDLAQINGLLEK